MLHANALFSPFRTGHGARAAGVPDLSGRSGYGDLPPRLAPSACARPRVSRLVEQPSDDIPGVYVDSHCQRLRHVTTLRRFGLPLVDTCNYRRMRCHLVVTGKEGEEGGDVGQSEAHRKV